MISEHSSFISTDNDVTPNDDVSNDDLPPHPENKVELRLLAKEAQYENPKLARLQRTLVEQFQDRDSRGILFSKTREGTRCLHDWVLANPELQRANIHAAILTGAGNGANHMTQVGPWLTQAWLFY